MRNQNKVRLFGYYKVAHIVFNVGLSLGLVILFLRGWEGRTWGIAVSLFFAAFISLLFLRKSRFLVFSFDRSVCKKILLQLGTLIPFSLQVLTLTQVGVFFIEHYFSRDLLGVYYVGFQVAFAVKLLFTALSLSWSPFLYKALNQDNIDKLKITSYYWVLFIIMLLGLVFVNVFAEVIVHLLVAEPFYGATEFVSILSLGFFFNGLYVFFTPVLIHHNQEKWLSITSIVATVLMVGLNIILPKFFGYMGITYAFCLAYLFLFVSVLWHVQRKVFPLPWLKSASNVGGLLLSLVGKK